MDDRKSRPRSANFTAEDKLLLASIVVKYKNIIENKKTDSTSNSEKIKCWSRVANEFNAESCKSTYRDYKSLKTWYENQKNEIKKSFAMDKAEIYKTGGGIPNFIKSENHQKIIASIMNPKCIMGLDNGGLDGDGMDINSESLKDVEPKNSTINFNIQGQKFADSQNQEDVINQDGSQHQNESFVTLSDVEFTDNCYAQDSVNVEVEEVIDASDVQTVAPDATWIKHLPISLSQPVTSSLKHADARDSNGTQTRSTNSKRISSASRRRPATTIKALASSDIAEKYNLLLDKRLAIADYKQQLMEKQTAFVEEKNKLKLHLLKLQTEEAEENKKRAILQNSKSNI